MEIVHAQEADLPGIRRLLGELSTYSAVLDPELFEGSSEVEPYAYNLLPNPEVLMLVAKDGNRVVGLAQGIIQTPPPIPVFVQRRYFVLHDLVVSEAQRRSGIGKALLAAVQDWVRAKGISEIELNVYASNATAARFYERNGFTPRMYRLTKRLD